MNGVRSSIRQSRFLNGGQDESSPQITASGWAALVRRAAAAQLRAGLAAGNRRGQTTGLCGRCRAAIFNNQLADPSIGVAVAIMVVLSSIAVSFAARAFGRAVA